MSASVFALCLFFDIPPVSANSCSRTKQTAKAKTETTATDPTVPSVSSVPSDLAKRMHSAIESGKKLHQFPQKQLDDVFNFLIDNADNDTILGEIDADKLMSAITVESESRDETVILGSIVREGGQILDMRNNSQSPSDQTGTDTTNTTPQSPEKSSTEDKKTPTLSDIKLSAPGKLAELLGKTPQTLRLYRSGARKVPLLVAEKVKQLDRAINGGA